MLGKAHEQTKEPDKFQLRMGLDPIHYIALDLDGTLLCTDKSISARTRAAIASCVDLGCKPIIATARPPRAAEEFLQNFFPDAPRIYYSGSLIRTPSETLLDRRIPCDIALQVVDTLLSRAPDATVSVEIDDRFYSTQPHEHALKGDVIDVREVLDREPVKIMLCITPGLSPDILADLPSAVRHVISDAGTLAQIMHADVSKSDAIRRVVAADGADLSSVIAFGDDTNDVEMIRDAGIGIAMANAVDSVKTVADHITESNDNDGIALVLEKLAESKAQDA
jgi:Cof subfamily protein (haloacid dehalogenase superfamily)